jgi:superfamily II DNA or RNA helicase
MRCDSCRRDVAEYISCDCFGNFCTGCFDRHADPCRAAAVLVVPVAAPVAAVAMRLRNGVEAADASINAVAQYDVPDDNDSNGPPTGALPPLRDYQVRAVMGVAEQFATGHRSALVVMPTGTGKTNVAASIIANWPGKRTLFLAHRDELITQAAKRIAAATGEDPGIEMAEFRAHLAVWESRHVVGCVPSVVRRLDKYNPDAFDLVVVDEAHHATAKTYVRTLEHFRTNTDCRIIGITATPDRADEVALGNIFETVAFDYQLPDAIRDGWLVPIEQQMVMVDGLDLGGVKTTAGDLNKGELAAVMEAEEVVHGVVHPTIELAGDAPTLLFAASVRHAEMAADIFNRHRNASAVCLHGKTPREERRRVLREFALGKFQYLCNCGLFLEGFDESSIGVVAIARPTKSRALYSQAIGRGTRALTGTLDGIDDAQERRAAIHDSDKRSLLVLDFVGNAGRHKLVTTADVLGGRELDDVVERAKEKAVEAGNAGRAVDMTEALAEAAREREDAERRRRASVVAKAKYRAESVNPFDVFDIAPTREPGWHKGRPATEGQVNALRKSKIPEVEIAKLGFHAASQLLNRLMKRRRDGLCTYKQAALLRKYNRDPDVTFEAASAEIDRIAQNGWKA